MGPKQEKSALKRARGSADRADSIKKPRRSQRLSAPHADENELPQVHLPSPVTRKESTSTSAESGRPNRKATESASPTPNENFKPHTPTSSPQQAATGLSSPPSDTQPFSQFIPPAPYSYEVKDEEEEGVWGYLVPLDGNMSQQDTLVLKNRSACPVPENEVGVVDGRHTVDREKYKDQEEQYEEKKAQKGVPAGGFLVGRHPECDRIINVPTVSNRHCLFFHENQNGDSVAVLEDLSGNGTYVNDGFVGRNKRRELNDGDEISILDVARFVFRYPRTRNSNGFRQQYTIHSPLGKGHFATVYLCTEKCSGMRYAVKHFERRTIRGAGGAAEEKSKVDGLQQEIAVLMSVSHPNMLCLKDTFNESDGVYLVLELAPEGELFNWIVMKHKLTEAETRKVFVQLFKGVKYLHERSIVHRDIKPENILVIDKDLHVKIADFGLAKIIGEESFTTTLCGTPSYVAPEILESGNRRRYTRAVDVWSLGVVLYICLCGFPPFSDELYTTENPYTLSQQIRMGRFDYPSPYWDSVGDPALDLIDRMLTVDVAKRISIDECLEHPWTTGRVSGGGISPTGVTASTSIESTDGLTGALGNLDFSARKPHRERTLLSAINDINITRVINPTKADDRVGKMFEKNPAAGDGQVAEGGAQRELDPAHARDAGEFAQMGGKGDQTLFEDNGGSNYMDQTMTAAEPVAKPAT